MPVWACRLVCGVVGGLVMWLSGGCSDGKPSGCNDDRDCPRGFVCGPGGVCLQDGVEEVDAGIGPDGDPDTDAGTDPGVDGGRDAGTDAAADPGVDAGTDAGHDTGADIDDWSCDPGVPVSVDILDETEMLIVTGEALAGAFEDLAAWKRAKGVPCQVVTTSWIETNVAGVDAAERLREHIRSLWSAGELGYVLLGGDADVVPCRLVQSNALFSYHAEFASDFYFSDLDGTFDANGNFTYGETSDDVEMHPDVAVARAPVSTAAEAELFVDRVLAYEQTDSGHVLDALFISEDTGFLDFDSALQLNPVADDTFPPDFDKQKLYWKHESYPDAVPNSLGAQVDALDTGKGFVTHYGHSGESWLNTVMSDDDVDALTNAPDFPVYVSCGCFAGNFAYAQMDAAGERLFTNPKGGAVAYLGNTNTGLGPGGGTALIKAFYQALFAGIDRLGDALFDARNNFYSDEGNLHNETLGIRWTQFVVVLFGDPEMPVRTMAPAALTVSHPTAIGRGEQCLPIQASIDGMPAAGITLALYRPGAFLYRQETDGRGRTVFRFTPGAAGDILVTATAPQSIPAQGVISVP